MDKYIPLSKLEEGIEKGNRHIRDMIDSSRILLESSHYTMSIATSVLILEELTKFRDMVIRLRDKKPFTKSEWDELSRGGSHIIKLVKLFEDVQNEVIQMGERHHRNVQELGRKLGEDVPPDFQTLSDKIPLISKLGNLNIIKKECIYLDWKGGIWQTFETKFSPDNQAILADFLQNLNLLTFLSVLLEHRHPTVLMNEQSSEFKAYQNDPDRIKISEIAKKSKTKEGQEKIQKALTIISSYSEQTD